MKALPGGCEVYQPLEAKTLTFSNADGLEFVTERTFLPPMVSE